MPKIKQASLLTPQQIELQKLIDEGLTNGTGAFADIFGKFDEQQFQEGVVNPELNNFKENILPLIMEKFTANNQSLGSAKQRGLLKAGTDLQSQLAALKYQAQQAQKQNRISGVNSSLGRQNLENIVSNPAQQSSGMSSLLPALGTAAGTLFGGPLGGSLGGAAGKSIVG